MCPSTKVMDITTLLSSPLVTMNELPISALTSENLRMPREELEYRDGRMPATGFCKISRAVSGTVDNLILGACRASTIYRI